MDYKSGTINSRDVDVPGPLLDYVVVAPKQNHWQSGTIEYNPRLSDNSKRILFSVIFVTL
jgi:acyl CoA:acetate/3-ketoacid CoA transferase